MPNPNTEQVGSLVLTAQCLPDPVAATAASDYDVNLENQGVDVYVVTELEVEVSQAKPGNSGLMLDRNGTVAYNDRIKHAGTYAQYAYGSWSWGVVNQRTLARAEDLVVTAAFHRQAAATPLMPGQLVRALSCECTVNVLVQ